MNSKLLNDIKAEASRLGFFSCGAARASAVEDNHAKVFLDMVANGDYATMDYLARNIDKRLDPRLLLEGADTLLCLTLNYTPSVLMNPDGYLIAQYAYGKDYHDVMKKRLHKLAETLNLQNFRVFCDTAPVLERYWAQKAGLGWIGKNHQLIVPKAGSRVFLGEILCSMPELWENSEESLEVQSLCGNCTKCEKACPTHTFSEKGRFICHRCLSYQTIENFTMSSPQNSVEATLNSQLSTLNYEETSFIYGCDRCLLACPYNQHAQPTEVEEFQLSPLLLNMTKEDWQTLTEEQYQKLFRGSAVKRAKYVGLVRNIKNITK